VTTRLVAEVCVLVNAENEQDYREYQKQEGYAAAPCCIPHGSENHTGLSEWPSDIPPEYSSLEDIFAPEAVKTIEVKIDELDGELRELSLKIHGARLDPNVAHTCIN
jgi:hypothetical protein